MKFSFVKALSLSAVLLSASIGNAGIITQWGFNNGATLTTGTGSFASSGTPTTPGSGLAVLPSGVYPASAFGSTADTAVTLANNGHASMNSAQPAAASGFGVQFKVNTTGFSKIAAQLDFKPASRASKYWQFVYTTDGTTWQNVPTNGVGSIDNFGIYTGTTVSNSGLVTLTVPSGLNTSAGNSFLSHNDWLQGLAYQFPLSGGAWENNPSFGVALYQIYNPTPTNAADTGYVSAQSGLNSSDTATGYIRSSAAGGIQWLDRVTVSSVPEPTSIAGVGLVGLLAIARRRKLAK